MKVTREDYADAIQLLLNATARKGTSGARASAQLLLSAYNGNGWQLDVTDLLLLDRQHYQAAITLIRGRIEIDEEPHHLIDDGGQIFMALTEKWKHLNVKERGKIICWDCCGQGEVSADPNNDLVTEMVKCRRCGGKGRYWEE